MAGCQVIRRSGCDEECRRQGGLLTAMKVSSFNLPNQNWNGGEDGEGGGRWVEDTFMRASVCRGSIAENSWGLFDTVDDSTGTGYIVRRSVRGTIVSLMMCSSRWRAKRSACRMFAKSGSRVEDLEGM